MAIGGTFPMGPVDILLITILVGSFIAGFFWGAVRALLLLATWLAAFLAAAHLKVALGSYLSAQWTNLSPQFNEMAAFGLIYVFLLLAAPVVIHITTKGDQSLVRAAALNDILGGFFVFAATLLGIAGLMVVMDLFYEAEGTDTPGGPDWSVQVWSNLHDSAMGEVIEERVVPVMGIVLRLLVPNDVREVMT